MPSLKETYVENTRIVRQDNANNYGTALGGDVVNWMDDTAMISAIRFAGEACVTASMGAIDFLSPLEVGSAAVIESYVYRAGNTSLKTHIRVYSEGVDRRRDLVTKTNFIYVAVDEAQNPLPVPNLEVKTEESEELKQKALESE